MSDESNPVPRGVSALRTHVGLTAGQNRVKGRVEVGENVILPVNQALAFQATLETTAGSPLLSQVSRDCRGRWWIFLDVSGLNCFFFADGIKTLRYFTLQKLCVSI